jgi:hypothetical protein
VANLRQSLGEVVGTRWKHGGVLTRLQRHSRTFVCRCGNHVFFRNTLCLTCGAPLGYLPGETRLLPLDPGPVPGTWIPHGGGPLQRQCANRDLPAQCNWLVAADDTNPLCIACRLNRTIPSLGDPDNARYWRAIELAKRRLVSQLVALGLPVKSKVDEDAERGLMFDFLRTLPDGPRVMTGYFDGLITLNVEEADDARREKIRHDMHEPYRTLLGHFRHEVGHYYWDRLIRDSAWLEPFRALFGDERADYAQALKANYANGPPADWADRYISSYASTHPWEDWAETWAHFLHVVDSLGTALGFGLDAGDIEGMAQPFERDALCAPDDPDAAAVLSLINSWIEMTMVLNELARSMGEPDFYPFVMSKPVVAKLQFVQLVVREARPTPAHG